MATSDIERRAFLASLEFRLVEIQEAAAARMPIHPTEAELDAHIAAARAEYRRKRRQRQHDGALPA